MDTTVHGYSPINYKQTLNRIKKKNVLASRKKYLKINKQVFEIFEKKLFA